MRKLILKMSMSLDGYVGGPQGEIEWIFRTNDEEATEWLTTTLAQTGVHIMGRRTYLDMVSYWPTSTEPLAATMNDIPKIVFSRSGIDQSDETTTALRDAVRNRDESGSEVVSRRGDWDATEVASGELTVEIDRLKALPGNAIVAHGGASFAQSLVRHGLVDEFQLLVHPVALGSGLPLFTERTESLNLTLVSSTAFRGGAMGQVYRPL